MQAERGWSYEDQLARGEEWVAREGHTVTTRYGQPGVSAAKADRAELLQIVDDARSDKWDALWIRDVMRFTRDPDDIKHLRAIEAYDKLIIEDGRRVTLRKAEDKLSVGIRVNLGAYQLDKLREFTSHGKARRARSGKRNWSVPPTGYNADATPADNAPGVVMIFDKFRLGIYGARDIAEMVSAAGWRTNAGHAFTADTVLAILRNKWYCGFVSYRGLVPIYTEAKRARRSKREIEWTRGEHTALIDESVWLECERIRLTRSGKRAGRACKPHRVYLLRGVAVCAGCGQRMRAHSSEYEKPKYRCSSRDRAIPCAASHAYVAESKLAPQVDEYMARLILPDEVRRRFIEMLDHAETTRDVLADQRKLQSQLERAKQLFEMGDYSLDQYSARKAELNAKLESLIVPQTTDVQAAIDLINDQAALWRGAPTAQRNTILRTLFDKIVIDVDAAQVVRFEPKSALAVLFQALTMQ
jgi:DNA invertase Pin-like site-specific DNA recombinase